MKNSKKAIAKISDYVLPLDCTEPLEKQIVLVRQEPRIRECTTPELKKLIQGNINYIILTIGCDPLSPIELKTFLSTIIISMGNYFPSEIKLAFNAILASKIGKLDDLNLYGKPLNVLYLTNIMHKYEQYRNPILAQAEAPPVEKEPTPEEIKEKNDKVMKESCISIWKEFYECKENKTHLEPIIDIVGGKYDFLSELGLIPDDEYKKFKACAKAEFEAEHKQDIAGVKNEVVLRDLIKVFNTKKSNKEALDCKMKELALRVFYDEVYNKLQDLEKLIVEAEVNKKIKE